MNARRWLALHVVLVCIFLLAPIVAAIILSFSSVSMLVLPPPGLSLQWYEAALHERKFVAGLINSLWIAGISSCIAGVAGTLAAVALNNYRFAGKEAMRVLLIMPLIVPSLVIGLGLLQTYTLAGIAGTGLWQASLGHAVIGLPYVVYLVLATMAHYDVRLEHASMTLGASRIATFLRITLPLIRPGVAAGMAFAFLVSFDEVALSLFLTRGDTLPLRLVQHIQYYADPSVAAVSSLLAVLSILALWLVATVLRQTNRAATPKTR